MGSSWAEENEDLHLETRLDAVEFCTGLLTNEFFIALKLKSKKRVTDGSSRLSRFKDTFFELSAHVFSGPKANFLKNELFSESSKAKKKGKPLKFDVIIDSGEFFDSPDMFYMWKYSPMGIWAYAIGKYDELFGILLIINFVSTLKVDSNILNSLSVSLELFIFYAVVNK